MKLFSTLLVALYVAINASAETNGQTMLPFKGTVVDSEGHPVAGATIQHYSSDSIVSSEKKVPTVRTNSDANGNFEVALPASFGRIVASKAGFSSAWVEWNPIYAPVTGPQQLKLSPPGPVSGTVVDDTGKAVADAKVYVNTAYISQTKNGGQSFIYLDPSILGDIYSARSDADGKFRLDGLPPNARFNLNVKSAGKVLHKTSRDFRPDTMMCQTGQQDLKLVLDPSGSIEGKVDVPGLSELDMQVRMWLMDNERGFSPEPDYTVAEKNGTFRFADVASGKYRIRVVFGTNALTDWIAEPIPVTVEAGQVTRDVKITAIKGGVLDIKVVSKDSKKPMEKVQINAFSQAYQNGSVSDSNGSVRLRLPPGEYQVTGYFEQSRSKQMDATVADGATNQIQLEIAPPPSISGTVRGPSGEPAKGVKMAIYPPHYGSGREVRTDDDGHFEIQWDSGSMSGLRGDVTPIVMARDLEHNLAASAELEEATTSVDLHLETGAILAGRVENDQGMALTNAVVHIIIWTGNTGYWSNDEQAPKIDEQGRFEIRALPAGRRYGAGARADGYGTADFDAETVDTNRVEMPAFVLKKADRKLSGRVVDSEDKPVEGAHVYIYGKGQPNTSLQSGAKGEFVFEFVCEGSIDVSASSQNLYGRVQADGGDTNVVITLGEQSGSRRPSASRASLTGKPLPDLATAGIKDAIPDGKALLICLFDPEQRPSRHLIRQLADQNDALKEKGVVVLAIPAAVMTADGLKEFKDSNVTPFPFGGVTEKTDANKWLFDTRKLPWLILTDDKNQVIQEGFAIDELDSKLKK